MSPHHLLPIAPFAFLLLACGAPPREPEPRRPGTGTVIVTVEGLKNENGQVLINLFLGPDGFPSQPDRAYVALERPITGDTVTARIEKVPAGPIAVAAFHDEDKDKELDTDFLGIPSEYWGVSKDASGFMGPPSYDDARLELDANAELRVRVQLR